MNRASPEIRLRLHRFALSGHCHRVELLLSLLELDVEKVDVDLVGREHKSPRFLALNPFGQVPVLEDNGLVLSDSNAILVYLDARYGGARFSPAGPRGAAGLQRWFSVAAGPLAFGPAAARGYHLFKGAVDLASAQQRAHSLLRVMNALLAEQPYLLGAALTLADIANYAYVARAPEGHVLLDEYPHVRAWLARIEATPRFIPMATGAP